MTRPSAFGASVIERCLVSSACGEPGCSSTTASAIARSTHFISYSAKVAPRQRRTPPPNGIHV